MAEQLIVNVTPYETRVASMDSGDVREVFVERSRDRGIVGNIYLGKVQRVLPGMQAAFVEIGVERAAFLYVGDVVPPEPSARHGDPSGPATGDPSGPAAELEAVSPSEDDAEETNPKGDRRRRRREKREKHRIEQLVKQGQQLLVQVTKDAIGTKGPRITCNISLPGRHLVFMPTHHHIGISRRITDESERQRLREVLEDARPETGGFVVRTVSAGLSEERLREDVEFLVHMWNDITDRKKRLSGPCLVQPELDLVLRCCRDLLTPELDRVLIDDKKTYEQARRFTELLAPSLLAKVQHFEQDDAIFDHFGVETELARAMSRKVWLRSGGYIVIDQAEALTAIDVNTGRFVGKKDLEETILKTNLEAVKEVAYQLRLRNIGGMVIIDFIDMEVEKHRDQVLEALEEALKHDRARSNVVKMSELGLVEMTRQRTRESLGRQLTETCWYCEGRGFLKSKRTLVYEIFRALEREAPRFTEPAVVVQTHPEVADVIYSEEREVLESIEARTKKTLVIKPRGSFHQEQFDIFGTSLEAAGSRDRRAAG